MAAWWWSITATGTQRTTRHCLRWLRLQLPERRLFKIMLEPFPAFPVRIRLWSLQQKAFREERLRLGIAWSAIEHCAQLFLGAGIQAHFPQSVAQVEPVVRVGLVTF